MRTAACCAAAAFAGLVPTPVGKGPRYRPAAKPPPAAACSQAPLRAGGRLHLELFANRRVVVVPAAVGLERPRLRLGRVVSARCRARLWTLDPSGVVRFERGATLGDLFATWRRRLGPKRLLTFRGRVHVWVDGRPRGGDPRGLRLRDRAEIVLEVGGYVPPHRSFRFPP
ncbi:MAG TPA: hypothetical protein VFJ77_05710 [Gaiellaceae bacterium]|nr:hypothetical protein [Gaiellaceae bacterium]